MRKGTSLLRLLRTGKKSLRESVGQSMAQTSALVLILFDVQYLLDRWVLLDVISIKTKNLVFSARFIHFYQTANELLLSGLDTNMVCVLNPFCIERQIFIDTGQMRSDPNRCDGRCALTLILVFHQYIKNALNKPKSNWKMAANSCCWNMFMRWRENSAL